MKRLWGGRPRPRWTPWSSLLLLAASCLAQPAINPDTAHLTTAHVQGNVYVLMGDGGNITVQIGKDGIALVDTGFAPLAPKAMAEIRKLSDGPVRWIVDTHVHADHTEGNAEMAKLGTTRESIGPPRIVAQSNVLNRMTTPEPGQPKVPEASWPNDEYFSPTKDFFFNGEAVVVYHVPNAHTDGDILVFFRRSDVLSTGDVFLPQIYPIIDLDRGGSVDGEIAALNKIIEITVPAKYQEGGEQCKSYGAPAIMRVPGRLHITWADENTLKIESDAGQQTRMFHFTGVSPKDAARSWQGYSAANWERPVRGSGVPGFGLGATREGAHGKSLEVVTAHLRAGYLRKNGHPTAKTPC